MNIERNYLAEATAKRFHADGEDKSIIVRGVRGVPSSGKSVMCLQECLLWAIDQWPYNGVRSTKFGIFRATYPALNMTTMKTVAHWFPEEVWPIRKSVPANQIVKFSLNDGTKVEMELVFLALETEEDVKKLKSLELTGVWLNEVFEMNQALVITAYERTGRFPPVINDRHGNRVPNTGPKRRGVWMDTNSPPDDHWYKGYEDNPPKGWKFYQQPAPLIRQTEIGQGGQIITVGWEPNPLAENIKNLADGYDYYLTQVAGMTESQLRVNIENKYGTTFKGKAVYEASYLSNEHRVNWEDTNSPVRGSVVVGLDTTGLNPGAVFGIVASGTLFIIDEIIGEDMPFEQFVMNVLLQRVRMRYAEADLTCVCDPANPRDARVGVTPIATLRSVGLSAVSAPTNTLAPRIAAVVHFLEKRNGFKVTQNCNILLTGFEGGYRYPKLKVAGADNVYGDKPVKDTYSTAHDSLQYLCSFLRSGAAVAGGEVQKGEWKERKARATNVRKWA